MRVLVVGWFSFEEMGATAGDLLSRDLVCRWLRDAGLRFDVAVAAPFTGGIGLHACTPEDYSHVVFVCGPFGNGPPITELLARFGHCRFFGLNLSMLQSLEQWNPFEFLAERDSTRANRPDLVFVADNSLVPVVGSVLVHPQGEYGMRALHAKANDAIGRLLDGRCLARVPIDTRLDVNAVGLRTPAEVESLLARMDVIVTTRLHGLVLGIRNAIPVLAIDPISSGAKVYRQAQSIGWHVVFKVDDIDDARLEESFNYCLTAEAREQANQSRLRAVGQLSTTREAFIAALGSTLGD